MPDLKAPAHSRNTCLQLCRMAFPESLWISPFAAWPVGPPLLLLPLPSPTIVLAVLPRERLCHFVHPSRITVKLVHLIHIPDMCRYMYCRRYTLMCQCTGFAGARAATPATQPRRKRSVTFVYDLVLYSSHACAQHNSRGCVTVAFVPPCTRLHT